MSFIYTKHSKVRIKQRNLKSQQIEETIIEPDKVTSSFKGRLITQKNFSGETLEVIFKKQGNNVIIITAYWLKEAN